MDYYKVLADLCNFDEHSREINKSQANAIINKLCEILSDDVKKKMEQDRIEKNIETTNLSSQYLHYILFTLNELCLNELVKDDFLISVNQLRTIKLSIQVAATLGIRRCLLTGIRSGPKIFVNFDIDKSDSNFFQKHKKLSYTVDIFNKCFGEAILRPALMPELGWHIAALLQLSHTPSKLIKRDLTISSQGESEEDICQIHDQIVQEQQVFQEKLKFIIQNCPQSMVIKELMMINGLASSHKWLQSNIKQYLQNLIVLPRGVISLLLAICDDFSDDAKAWEKLSVCAKLLAASHGPDNMESYYNSICPQIIEILKTNELQYGTTIANCCIRALYDYKPEICIEKILNVIMDPFLIDWKVAKKTYKVLKTEKEVTDSIDNLVKLFITSEAEFKCLPPELLTRIAVPLLYAYAMVVEGVYVNKHKISQLLLKMLSIKSMRERLYFAFLDYHTSIKTEFGNKLSYKYGPNGGIEITNEPSSILYQHAADALYKLLSTNGEMASDLFMVLLKISPKLNEAARKAEKGLLLEDPEDAMGRIERQIIVIRLLSILAATTIVQERQIQHPEALFEFIESLFPVILEFKASTEEEEEDNADVNLLHTALVLIKVIIAEQMVEDWEPYDNFVRFIDNDLDLRWIPNCICEMLEGIKKAINQRQFRPSKNYEDFNVEQTSKTRSEYDKAMADLGDILLPVKAHAIIVLTKLIDKKDPQAVAGADFLFHVFKACLTHEDSFLYLAAINGICALSYQYPDKCITVLAEAFTKMVDEADTGDIGPDTRAKLGEILVKTTRSLGEMLPTYKELLVNTFLNGVRDPDPLVRSSSLSCLGEFCKIMGFRLGNLIVEILNCIGCIVKSEKDDSCRRAAVLVATLLLRGLGKDALTELGQDLITLYRGLKHLRDHDKDPVLQLHAQLALEEFDEIVQEFLFKTPNLSKSIFLLSD